MSYKPTREEVETFLQALNYGMKVEYKKDFMIALAEAWLREEAETLKTVGLYQSTPEPVQEHYLPAALVVKNDLVAENGSSTAYRPVARSVQDGELVTLFLAGAGHFSCRVDAKIRVLR